MKTPAIEFTTNYVGFLPSFMKSALYNYMAFPNVDNWNDIYCTVISTGEIATVWQAVIAVDPTFPQIIECDSDDNTRWSRIPEPELVSRAIAHAVFSKLNQN